MSSRHSTWKTASPSSHGSVQSVCWKTQHQTHHLAVLSSRRARLHASWVRQGSGPSAGAVPTGLGQTGVGGSEGTTLQPPPEPGQGSITVHGGTSHRRPLASPAYEQSRVCGFLRT